jgi:hypothetical protein
VYLYLRHGWRRAMGDIWDESFRGRDIANIRLVLSSFLLCSSLPVPSLVPFIS